jgi:hypothetical protein
MYTAYVRPANTKNTSRIPRAALLAFFSLFPGFFFYHTSVSLGLLRPFLGGYFTIISTLLFFPLIFSYCIGVKRRQYRISTTDLCFITFLFYFLLIVAVNTIYGADTVTAQTHLLSILYLVNIYLIFQHINFSNWNTFAMALASLSVMSAIIFLFSKGGSFQPGQIGTAQSPESVVTYQGFARSYVLTFVAVISYTKGTLARTALYITATAALFLNGSRSELVAVLVLIPIVEIYRARNGLHVLCIVLLVLGLGATDIQSLIDGLPDNRVWELFDLSHSESATSRYNLTQNALGTIAEHPLLGDYASYPPGSYSHNILSAWVDLGAFGILYLLCMLMQAAVSLFVKGWRVKSHSGHFLLAWILICMSLLLLITSKAFDDMFTGAAMGAYANYRYRMRNGSVSVD